MFLLAEYIQYSHELRQSVTYLKCWKWTLDTFQGGPLLKIQMITLHGAGHPDIPVGVQTCPQRQK